jgi:sirohydrochlorin ferrochelatase
LTAINSKAGDSSPCVILLDNGSRRAASTLNLRHLADSLSSITKTPVNPVSLLHSDKVAPSDINGEPARILEPFLINKLSKGISDFLVVPLFFGQTAAVYEYIPQRVDEIRKEHPQLNVCIASCLVDLDAPSDHSMAEILARLVRRKVKDEGLSKPGVILVDHGTPRISVNKVRNLTCLQLCEELAGEYGCVEPASMERRKDSEYDFNEPLLEGILGTRGFEHDVVVALLFCSPGRHAGEGGDILTICEEAEQNNPGLRVFTTDLPSSDSAFLDILASRLNDALMASFTKDSC